MPVYDQYGRTDNYMTGALPYRSMAGGPVQGSKTDRGVRTEFVQPQNQATDQVAYRSSPGLASRSVQTVAVDPFTGTPLTAGGMNSRDVIADIPGPAPMAPAPTIDAATPLDGYRLALTPTPAVSAPLAAIDGATSFQPGMMGRGQPSMQWEPAVASGPAPAPGVDPWASSRMGTDGSAAEVPGMITGPAPQTATAMAGRAPQARVSSAVLRAMVEQQRNKVVATDPRRGKKIMTANNGEQTVGTRLNNSSRGFTVTGDDWFNSVRGL